MAWFEHELRQIDLGATLAFGLALGKPFCPLMAISKHHPDLGIRTFPLEMEGFLWELGKDSQQITVLP